MLNLNIAGKNCNSPRTNNMPFGIMGMSNKKKAEEKKPLTEQDKFANGLCRELEYYRFRNSEIALMMRALSNTIGDIEEKQLTSHEKFSDELVTNLEKFEFNSGDITVAKRALSYVHKDIAKMPQEKREEYIKALERKNSYYGVSSFIKDKI